MLRTVVCTICSKEKIELHKKKLLPARIRYLGPHIPKVGRLAERSEMPFFILSGVHGFIFAEETIQHYDHLLVASEVSALSKKIQEQLKQQRVGYIHFYTKRKPNWAPYLKALQLAADALRIPIKVHELSDDD